MIALPTPLTTSPLQTLTSEDITDGTFDIASLSPEIRGFISDFEAPKYIYGPLAQKYSLEPEQEYAVARFLMELVLGTVTEVDTTARLSNLADVDLPTARRMLKNIEDDLLTPNDLSYASLIHGAAEPLLVADQEGREGLRYPSLDNLMTDLEPLEPKGRLSFLNDAKKFNRIFVLEALSQLKMGTDSNGLPLTFRQQVAHESGEFSALDWIDLLRVDPDAVDEPAVWNILRHTALGAMVQDRDVAGRREISSELAGVSPDMQALATTPVVGSTIDAFVTTGVLPETHSIAVERVVFFLCVGRLQPLQTVPALEQIGIPPAAAQEIANRINALLPVRAIQPSPSAPIAVSPAPPVRIVPTSASRNIIDLRKQQRLL